MDLQSFNADLLPFLQQSPSPFHAVANMARQLEVAGFQRLDEADVWHTAPGQGYYVTRNDSSLIAFRLGQGSLPETGLRLVGAHTDSPCLKVKPQPELVKNGYFQLGVEVYGGALLNPWFDRDLSLAGRISYRNRAGQIRGTLIDFPDPIAVIPSLAIHLDREVNQNRSINAQLHLPPLLWSGTDDDARPDFRSLLLEALHRQQPDLSVDTVLDFELCLYDTQPPALVGLEQDFIASARLDNLLSCYTGLQALLQAGGEQTTLLVCTDHEEVGSASHCGADGPFLKSVLERLCASPQDLTRALHRSLLISADNAHALHPNYADKHDENHGPRMNGGPVIKINASQRYASNSETSAVFRHLAQQVDVPVQSFVVRSDQACGSTIGPITASGLGVRTLDVGVPQLAMHSIRELAGARDGFYLFQILQAFYSRADIGI
ncbi:MAG: M18 family aminopeptidase [Gammaproteobacteria bacterium]|nr:M18 family aminopeptidase [Gammaproteobacteria bacterium]